MGISAVMNLEDLIELDRIGCQIQVLSKKKSLEQVSTLISIGHPTLTGLEVFECLLSRERLGSTGIGHGVAIPHGRSTNVDHIRGAFIQLQKPVDFDAIDREPVDLIFALLAPEQEADQQHVEVLGKLVKIFRDPRNREQLRAARDAQVIMRILNNAWPKE